MTEASWHQLKLHLSPYWYHQRLTRLELELDRRDTRGIAKGEHVMPVLRFVCFAYDRSDPPDRARTIESDVHEQNGTQCRERNRYRHPQYECPHEKGLARFTRKESLPH